MGKKRIVKKGTEDQGAKKSTAKKLSRKKLESGILHVNSTFNNTTLLLTDDKGNAIASSSSGALGFKGAKKGTPFAAAEAANTLLEKAEQMALKRIKVVVCGVGAGRDSAVRSFISRGIQLISIVDKTPVPHNGPKPKKPRRV